MKGIEGSKDIRGKLVIFKDKTLNLTSVPNGGMIGIKGLKSDRIKVKLSSIFLFHLLLFLTLKTANFSGIPIKY